MTKVKAEAVSQYTEVRLIDGVETVCIVKVLPLDPGTQRTTIKNVKGAAPAERSHYVGK